MSQIKDEAFELGKQIMSLRRRVQAKKEVLIHQSCDDILKILNNVDEDVSEIIDNLEKIKWTIEWNDADVKRIIFWSAIGRWVEEIERDLKEEI